MAQRFLVLTVIGDDRPGLVGELAAAIAGHEGNWLESAMSHLAGKFAGIVKVGIAAERIAGLQSDLGRLPGLAIRAEASEPEGMSGRRRLRMNLVGHDRIGIVREVSAALARHGVNVEELATRTESAPMSAEVLFHAQAELTASPTVDVRALVAELERISNDLMVEISLDEAHR